MLAQVGLELNKKIQHVAAATAEEVQGLSEQLNRFLGLSIQSGLLVCNSGTAWFALFKHMDDDGSGRISYAELRATVRDTLRCDKKELPELKLLGLWKALDDDGSGFISAGEFGRFMRAGETDTQAKRTADARKQLQRRLALQKQEMRSDMDKLVGRDINVKLKRVKAMSDEEMDALSTFLNRRMHEVSRVRDWYKLYKIIDNDGSGRICFGELADPNPNPNPNPNLNPNPNPNPIPNPNPNPSPNPNQASSYLGCGRCCSSPRPSSPSPSYRQYP